MDSIEILTGKICPYCQCPSKLVKGEEIYPHLVGSVSEPKFLKYLFYQCSNVTDHYVGTYRNSKKSLGRIANKELRELKKITHSKFDPLWTDKFYFKTRNDAYVWLSDKMNLPVEFTHIGMFNPEQCERVIKLIEEHF